MNAPFAAITVPIDATTTGQHAIQGALTFAEPAATLHFCSVVDVNATAGAATAMGDLRQLIDAIASTATSVCDDAVAAAKERGYSADGTILYGKIARSITNFARANGSQAILVCTHARQGLARAFAGSVTEDLFTTSNVPVIVTHANDDAVAGGPITVALDGSEPATAALETAIELALAERRPLSIVYVVEPADEWNEAAGVLGAAAERVRTTSLDFELSTLRGKAAPTVIAAARACNSPLIVIGTHGRSGLTRAVLGSVAAEVVEQAGVPVVVVRQDARGATSSATC